MTGSADTAADSGHGQVDTDGDLSAFEINADILADMLTALRDDLSALVSAG